MDDLPHSVFVINLDTAHARWEAVQHSHATHLGSQVALRRVRATSADDVRELGVPGAISPAEKGCLISHLRALELAAAHGSGPYWIAEDDIAFGPSTLRLLRLLLARLASARWDVLFTDLIIAQPKDMLDLWMRRHGLRALGGIDVFGLDRMSFGGTTSYLVHPQATVRIRKLMQASPILNMPWDIWLRTMARRRQLTCLATLPFLTAATPAPSQIQNEDMHMAWWGIFRDLLFQDADAVAISGRIAEREAPPQLDSLFGQVIGQVSGSRFMTPAKIQARAASIARASNAESLGSVSNSDSSA